jgi:hypothetical protein
MMPITAIISGPSLNLALIFVFFLQVDFKRLPFDHCALSLQPFENPYCDEEGNVFDLGKEINF